MLSEPVSTTRHAVELVNVSKSYRLYARPVDRVLELLLGVSRFQPFTALHTLNLSIPKGTCLGILGENGAGKSTLMHLIAGSHQPTTGHIHCHGQVLGLLELGIGFHPEFTGRQNVYFYGDMLGLKREFVQKRFADILSFADIGAFIDQPLRTYSTGMKVRLAFALVASLDPDILIIDEALSVGDLQFQKKCVDRMTHFRQQGKTIIFCSHSLYQIESFCDEVLWLKAGKVEMHGTPAEVIAAYQRYQIHKADAHRIADPVSVTSPEPGLARIVSFAILSQQPLFWGDELILTWEINTLEATLKHHYTLSIKLDNGRGLYVTGSKLRGESAREGSGIETLRFPAIVLAGAYFTLHLRIWDDTGLIRQDERIIDAVEVRKTDQELGVLRMPHHSTWSAHKQA